MVEIAVRMMVVVIWRWWLSDHDNGGSNGGSGEEAIAEECLLFCRFHFRTREDPTHRLLLFLGPKTNRKNS